MDVEKKCTSCGAIIPKIFLPASKILGTEQRWMTSPKNICDNCINIKNKLEDAEKKRILTQHNYNRIFADFAPANSFLSQKYANKTFKNFIVKAENRDAYNSCLDFAKKTKGKSLFLFGHTGAGKTHLAFATAKEMMHNHTILAIEVPFFFLKLKSQISDKNNNSYDLINKAKTVDVLIMTNLISKYTTKWVLEILLVIIAYRSTHKLLTLFTSNHSIKDISILIDDGLSSVLKEMCVEVTLSGIDARDRLGRMHDENG